MSPDKEPYQPLAARMRPRDVDEILGQSHLLAPGRPLREIIDCGKMHSMIFWGPPGVGKTTLARLLSQHVEAHFESICLMWRMARLSLLERRQKTPLLN